MDGVHSSIMKVRKLMLKRAKEDRECQRQRDLWQGTPHGTSPRKMKSQVGISRDGFTNETVDHFMGLGYNVLVIKTSLVEEVRACPPRMRLELEVCHVFKCTIGFYIYVAPQGRSWTIKNKGDGGYTNWCMGGNFERNGKYVTFF